MTVPWPRKGVLGEGVGRLPVQDRSHVWFSVWGPGERRLSIREVGSVGGDRLGLRRPPCTRIPSPGPAADTIKPQ